MDTTDCLGLPYPECDPPLTKDASDIEQFEDLAFAVDAAVDNLADIVQNSLVTPPMVKMFGSAARTGNEVTHFLLGTDWDTQGMADVPFGVIRVQEDGWYMIGGFIRAQDDQLFMRVEPLLNGSPFSSRQGPSFTLVFDQLMWTDVGFFQAGDTLNFMTVRVGNPADSVTYSFNMWALQVMSNV